MVRRSLCKWTMFNIVQYTIIQLSFLGLFLGGYIFALSKAWLFGFTIFSKLKPIAAMKALFALKVNKYSCIRVETEIRKVMKHFMDILGP